MKKKILAAGVALVIAASGIGILKEDGTQEASVYFADQNIQRLMPMDYQIPTKNPQKAARFVLEELTDGSRRNPKVMQLFPEVKNGVRVTVREETAYVDFSREFVERHSAIRQHEILTVYAIVNSLTSLQGIVKVKFTIDGKTEKDFKGFLDMRETFIPDYYI